MAMDVVEFPLTLRRLIAALDLQLETAQISTVTYGALWQDAVELARTALGLDASYRTDPMPDQPHNPGGYTSVFWKVV